MLLLKVLLEVGDAANKLLPTDEVWPVCVSVAGCVDGLIEENRLPVDGGAFAFVDAGEELPKKLKDPPAG